MIRRPKTEDLKALEEFFHLVISDTFSKEGLAELVDDINGEVKSKMEYIIKDINSYGQEMYFLVYEIDNKIVGTAAIGPSGHLIYDHIPKLKSVKELGSVLIHPEYQGQGIGTKLVDEIIDRLSEITNEYCLDSGYTIAKQIWTKKFGEPTKILRDFWAPGADHYIWHIKFPSTQ
ncbi:MAG: GNAT family N-acetyltransferase [Clostridiales bacterium]|nr:GNAT family N-acetyltransferase [Clostridiales bacterium]